MNKEEQILEFWKEKDIFHKSIKNRSNSSYFSFYDGPPFATGKPHYGHILATTIKDTVLRYWTMKGYQVPRRVGWDCHGLPVENLIEKELEIKNKKQIEEIGVEKFNEHCRSSVFNCVNDFQKTLERVGRWADYDEAYSTMDNNYIESVWWVLKQLWEKGLVEKNYRVSPYCPRCGTTLSNFEVNQGYKETKNRSVYVKFKVEENTFLLVWTTTPWTLPGNVALAVNEDLEYSYIQVENEEIYILATERLSIINGEYKILKKVRGKDLIGIEYEPLFNYLPETKNAFKVLPGEFVSNEDGSGIVHINPMYGEDDFNIGKKYDLPFFHTVDNSGRFKDEVSDFKGEFVKDADIKIIEKLKERNILFKEELITHEYPFCWRCDSPLLYYAIESWYVSVTKIKDRLLENNKKIHWVPENIKEGRFGKWLEGARDWDIARSRFWGAPIPIWECECGEKVCIGSIQEMKDLSVKEYNLKDIHLPYIDEVKLKCSKCGKEMKRTPEVFDCWFESGSMPYAQWHYPFENKDLVEKTYPADFIAEGLDQTRGWFYTLHVLATALTMEDIGLGESHPAFKNVIVNGLVLDDKGRKLSKKLKNYPAPDEIFDSFGADALRYFLLASTSIGEDYRFSKDKVKEYWRKVISGLDNCFTFFETYKKDSFSEGTDSLLDKWIISKTEKLNRDVIEWMDQYELTKASRLFNDYIDDLSNWYIRRSRRRFQKPESEKEKEQATYTLNYAISKLIKLMAPFTPFITEDIFLKMNGGESIHLCDYPQSNLDLVNEQLESEMENIREIVNLALAERSKQGIKVRQALSSLSVKELKIDKEELIELIKEEINIKEVKEDKGISEEVELDTIITPELREEGNVREIIRQIQQMRKDNGFIPEDRINVYYAQSEFFDTILKRNKEHILSEVLANEFISSAEDLKEINIDENKIYLNIKKI
ncbi:MAG: isoleucine--tRNA ligase [Candidatus Pacebacteria bacterium]|nr:isoleucine--tRNA ligase [Candidatus Paceibacterota bacterium]MDD2757504.1 isoleucine--tRNA ligase [Candidatus Paceibacterota bacterium]MDD3283641.1 isoleucine--tRNA ligase [Candidatus Paceibacterota bacterium]MDD3969736.1 isoleucine--tRNA ligase [Candidatus Paceibacterota bacterium]MDD4737669.1 isoleucine--tRNA ligase [Candidatus Paceibacterota bacterium]